MKKPIVNIPHKVLFSQAKTITVFDEKLLHQINDMKDTLLSTDNPKGVGLAGPQVGLSLRLFITRPTEKSPIRVFINPEILQVANQKSEKSDDKLEGCLSVPKIWSNVTRSPQVKLRYQDETGKIHEEEFSGFEAVIIQHETDHTNGIIFTQRAVEQHAKLYQQTIDKQGKEVLQELDLK